MQTSSNRHVHMVLADQCVTLVVARLLPLVIACFQVLQNVWEVTQCNLVIVSIGWHLSIQRELALNTLWWNPTYFTWKIYKETGTQKIQTQIDTDTFFPFNSFWSFTGRICWEEHMIWWYLINYNWFLLVSLGLIGFFSEFLNWVFSHWPQTWTYE